MSDDQSTNTENQNTNDDDQNTSLARYTCLECQAGIMTMKPRTYFTWLAGELITVPDFPAWVCDVCGRSEHDVQAIIRLNILLNPGAGHSSRSPNRKPRTYDRPSIQP